MCSGSELEGKKLGQFFVPICLEGLIIKKGPSTLRQKSPAPPPGTGLFRDAATHHTRRLLVLHALRKRALLLTEDL